MKTLRRTRRRRSRDESVCRELVACSTVVTRKRMRKRRG
jgi:hypothetical protein